MTDQEDGKTDPSGVTFHIQVGAKKGRVPTVWISWIQAVSILIGSGATLVIVGLSTELDAAITCGSLVLALAFGISESTDEIAASRIRGYKRVGWGSLVWLIGVGTLLSLAWVYGYLEHLIPLFIVSFGYLSWLIRAFVRWTRPGKLRRGDGSDQIAISPTVGLIVFLMGIGATIVILSVLMMTMP